MRCERAPAADPGEGRRDPRGGRGGRRGAPGRVVGSRCRCAGPEVGVGSEPPQGADAAPPRPRRLAQQRAAPMSLVAGAMTGSVTVHMDAPVDKVWELVSDI